MVYWLSASIARATCATLEDNIIIPMNTITPEAIVVILSSLMVCLGVEGYTFAEFGAMEP